MIFIEKTVRKNRASGILVDAEGFGLHVKKVGAYEM